MFLRFAFLVAVVCACSSELISSPTPALPVCFEGNRGQAAESVRFTARSETDTAILRDRAVDWRFAGMEGTLRLNLSRTEAHPTGSERLSTKVNYLNARNPIIGVNCYGRVRYANVFPQIDLELHFESSGFEYDVIVKPGARVSDVRLPFSGASSVEVSASGDLVFRTGAHTMRHHAPEAYQMIAGVRRKVDAKFRVLAREGETVTIGFDVAAYDRGVPLVIDPVITYTAHTGGSGNDLIVAMEVDKDGNVYVAGNSTSPDLPVHPQAIPYARPTDCKVLKTPSGGFLFSTCSLPFIAKLKADASEFEYITYVGTNGSAASSLTIDAQGNAYVAGATSNSGLVVTTNALQNTPGKACTSLNILTTPCTTGFISKINSKGDTLLYSTYFGGSDSSTVSGIRVDGTGGFWVSGTTSSVDLPVTGANGVKLNGPQDAFVSHINAAGKIAFSRYFGGSGYDRAFRLATDGQHNVYFAGMTDSTDLPVTAAAAQPEYRGGADTFLTKLRSDGSVVFSTYWGTPHGDIAEVLAVDKNERSYLGVASSTSDIVLSNLFNAIANPLTKLEVFDGTGSHVATYSSQMLSLASAAIGLSGDVVIAGQDLPLGSSFTPDALQTCGGSARLDRISSDLKTLLYSSQVPGAVTAFDSSGSFYLAGNGVIQKQDVSKGPTTVATCALPFQSYDAQSIAPGEMVSIYGRNIGPDNGVVAHVDATGTLPFSLAGVTVTFDGVAAPLMFVQSNQVNVVVPLEAVGKSSTTIKVTYNNNDSPELVRAISPASNRIVQVNYNAAALNQDGSLNSKSNPAKRGSIMTIFTSGAGQTNPPVADGQVVTQALPLALPAKVLIFGTAAADIGTPAETTYAGSAPGWVAGSGQINFRLPANLPASTESNPSRYLIALVVGDTNGYSTGGEIYVQ